MAIWKRKPQERRGNYYFAGRGFITRGIATTLSSIEIATIYADLMRFVEQEDGVDYLQVYICDDGRRVWCIDQLSQAQLEGDAYTPAQKEAFNYWTMLLPSEY